MTDIAIWAEGLGKQFHIGELQRSYKTFREVTVDAFLSPLRRMRRLVYGQAAGAADLDERFWALRDVGFQIRQGEVVGIIGRNGAGKSTLLKILSRITEPTTGFVEAHGRVGSLLEVGTGFHPELTGRENIYLNGAILGMRQIEIDRKFDDIVAFAEIDRFLDTPVKHYSTGMQTRLGFAVAAHLDPEILLVDEVLAVGDAAFQHKCLGKMQDVARGGRTVVFVSHNMGSVAQLCKRVIWLDQGRVRSTGDPSQVIEEYLSDSARPRSHWFSSSDGTHHRETQIISVRVLTASGEPTLCVPFDRDFKIEIAYQVNRPTRNLGVLCRVTDSRGIVVWSSWDTDSTDWESRVREPGEYLSICHVPGKLLRPGRYLLTLAASAVHGRLDFHEDALSLEVSEVGWRMNPGRTGVITPVLRWEVISARKPETIFSYKDSRDGSAQGKEELRRTEDTGDKYARNQNDL
jgi:lipopolysaccharide transport system ATP-binding protein